MPYPRRIPRYRYQYKYETPPEKTLKEKARTSIMISFGLTALATLAYGVYPNGSLDLLGDRPKNFDDEHIEKIYNDPNKSLGTRYNMQYLGTRNGRDSQIGGNGFLSVFRGKNKTAVGEDCLANTAYDTGASIIEINGAFVSGGGDISAVASLEQINDETLIVHPNNGKPLDFSLADSGVLMPSESTEQILAGYSCRLAGILPEELFYEGNNRS